MLPHLAGQKREHHRVASSILEHDVEVEKQITKVRELLDQIGMGSDVPVHGMLCFVEGDWPLLGGSFVIGGFEVLWPKKARKIISAPGPITDEKLRVLHRELAAAFPPA